jgi:hypothetical protein
MTIQHDIMKRVTDNGRGKWVFTPRDFFDFGSRPAVNQALARLAKSGTIRRLNRGLYDLPTTSRVTGNLVPASIDLVVDAIIRRDGIKVLPAPAVCANNLGLSTQVPAKAIFDTDGISRVIKIGNRDIRFQHASPKVMRWHGRSSMPVAQAVAFIGPRIKRDYNIPVQLNRILPDDVKADFLGHADDLPGWAQWIPQAMRDIAAA